MDGLQTSQQSLLKMLDVVQCCVQASSEPAEVERVVAVLRQIVPFSALAICLDQRADLSLEGPRQLVNFGYQQEWVELYFAREFQFQDPVILQSRCQPAALTWHDCYAAAPKPGREFLLASQRFVGNNGVVCSVKGRSSHSATLISMVLPVDEPAQRHVSTLGYLAPHLHEIFNRRGPLNRCSLMAPEISRRELEVLYWAKEGKSTWDISNILSISERTVKFHFGNIFRKFDVLNRSQAIAKAIHYGVIAV